MGAGTVEGMVGGAFLGIMEPNGEMALDANGEGKGGGFVEERSTELKFRLGDEDSRAEDVSSSCTFFAASAACFFFSASCFATTFRRANNCRF